MTHPMQFFSGSRAGSRQPSPGVRPRAWLGLAAWLVAVAPAIAAPPPAVLAQPAPDLSAPALPAPALPAAELPAPELPTGPALPPIVAGDSGEHHPGKMVFAELVTSDLAGAARFYGTLFGWRIEPLADARARHAPSNYAQAMLGGHPVAGMVERPIPPGEHRQPSWISFFAVTDMRAARQLAEEHGARPLLGPHRIPGRGAQAVLADPQGAVFAIIASQHGDPPDLPADPGEWIWSALITTDPDAAAGFYQTLFDYEVFELPPSPGAQHLILADAAYARASVNTLPSGQPGQHSHWISFIRVADAAATAARVTALGGRVLEPPRMDRHGARVALVADPQGAAFGVMEWRDEDTPGPGDGAAGAK